MHFYPPKQGVSLAPPGFQQDPGGGPWGAEKGTFPPAWGGPALFLVLKTSSKQDMFKTFFCFMNQKNVQSIID
jgi:hypothetical protein